MADSSNINSNVSGNAQTQYVGPIGPMQAPQTPAVNPANQSSIGPSQAAPPNNLYAANDPKLQEALVTLILSQMAGSNQLQLVGDFNTTKVLMSLIDSGSRIDGGSVAMKMLNQMSQIVTDMWDGFMQGIREQDERQKEWRESAAYQDHVANQQPESKKFITNSSATQFEAYIDSLPAGSRDEILYANLQRSEAADNWRGRNLDGIEAFANTQPVSGGIENSPKVIMMTSMVIGAPLITDYLKSSMDPSSADFIAVKVVQEGINAVPQAVLIPPDLGVLGALLVNAAIYRATGESSVASLEKGQKPVNEDMAKKYADRIIALVSGDGIKNYVTAIITHNLEQIDEAAQQKITEWTAVLSVILLSSALALLYKTQTKSINEVEFEAMVNFAGRRDPVTNEPTPIMKQNAESIEKELSDLIAGQLSHIRPELKKAMVAALYDYIAMNPSVSELVNPQVVLSKSLSGISMAGGTAAVASIA